MPRRLCWLLLLCTAALAQKQKTGEEPSPVKIDFTVTAPDGAFVPGLTAAGFTVTQDDKPVKLLEVSQVDAPSRTVVFVVDDLGLSLDGLYHVKRALRQFVAAQVKPGDRIVIVRTGVHRGAALSFTSDTARLTAAIDGLHYNHLRDTGVKPADTFEAGTLLQLRFLMDELKKSPSRCAVVLLSERLEAPASNSSRHVDPEHSASRITDKANEARAILYAVRVQPTPGAAAAPPLRTGLAAAVHDTGGLWIEGGDLAAAFARVLADQSQYYSATVVPPVSEMDFSVTVLYASRFPKMAVGASRPGVTVRARSAVYAPADADSPILPGYAGGEESDGSPLDGGAIGIRATPLLYYGPDGPYVEVLIHIEGKGLTFVKRVDGQYRTAFAVTSVAFDGNQQSAGEVGRTLEYSLTEAEHQAATTAGILLSHRFRVERTGVFHVRTAVLDEATRNAGSAGEYLEIPDIKDGKLALSGVVLEEETRSRPAVREFRPGARLTYSLQIYNLTPDAANKCRADVHMRLSRSGVEIFSGPLSIVPFDVNDAKSYGVKGTMGLKPEMTPGHYVLQLTVTDKVANSSPVSRLIDLEVRP